MTKTRRGLMVLLFVTMVLGVGLFLPGNISKQVKADENIKIELRTSRRSTWYWLSGYGFPLEPHYFMSGYAPFNWITFQVTVPKVSSNLNPPPPISDNASFVIQLQDGRYISRSVTSPSFSSITPTKTFYYYRLDLPTGTTAKSAVAEFSYLNPNPIDPNDMRRFVAHVY